MLPLFSERVPHYVLQIINVTTNVISVVEMDTAAVKCFTKDLWRNGDFNNFGAYVNLMHQKKVTDE